MNLKTRFMLLMLALFVIAAAIVWVLVRQLSESIVEEWATRYAEKQVLYDKGRTLQPILREIALSRQFATSQQLLEWAHNPSDDTLTQKAITEMETFRRNFSDHSYFVALLDSGRYYHNNAENEYADQQYRYTLDPERSADRWFYDIVQQNRDMHLNVNPDVELGVTKLWIDMLMRDGERILGVAGTGLDLTHFLNDVVDPTDPGITRLFIDHDGAIQLFRDQNLIDFASITKASADKKTVDRLFSDHEDRQAVRELMQQLAKTPDQVLSRFVTIDNRRHLAGIAYLPEIGWYEITLLDLDVILPLSHFTGILLSFGLMLLISLFMLHIALSRFVIRPLGQLESAMDEIRQGHAPSTLAPISSKSEIGRLTTHFQTMAHAVQRSREELETKVLERTKALELQSKTDPLTDLLNRRGMQERLESQTEQLEREGRAFGLIWLDLDGFKDVNDRFGHEAGDRILVGVAQQIRSVIRPYDSAARWGGDEFLVLIQTEQRDLVHQLCERVREAVEAHQVFYGGDQEPVSITLSAGSHLAREGESLETILHSADQALYQAKAAGRNRCIAS
ncbi:Diguanylate cyclase/phosphodiesterase domain 2 [Marinobacterium lacunae]|uniref:diguanylate cyclase n=1 Tax=Marinobacterium lacunae TaxID=1232683 RepID=A0A081FXG3_9GAMM|nr:GGDEF domain-containing protein [Marinobacterium lacunae]KEA63218.1 Diguanylate cyclase/phosphodiesterase domain 2 [Marinobacterium lacunae]